MATENRWGIAFVNTTAGIAVILKAAPRAMRRRACFGYPRITGLHGFDWKASGAGREAAGHGETRRGVNTSHRNHRARNHAPSRLIARGCAAPPDAVSAIGVRARRIGLRS
jgi:hypothetical protein